MRNPRDPPEGRDIHEMAMDGSSNLTSSPTFHDGKNSSTEHSIEHSIPPSETREASITNIIPPTTCASKSSTSISIQESTANHIQEVTPNRQERMCDYDTDPTMLYSLLEASDWNIAATRCKTHPMEVRTWIVRRDKETKLIRWSLLPIHAAVIFQSPKHIVQLLLEQYQGALARCDDQGMTPLHLAVRHGTKLSDKNSNSICTNEDLIGLLLSNYPKAVTIKDCRGRKPLDLAAANATYSANTIQRFVHAFITVASQEQIRENAISIAEAAKKYETSIRNIKEDYILQIKRLYEVYENRIHQIHQDHKEQIEQLQEDSRQERQQLVNVHHEEIKALHQVLKSKQLQEIAAQDRERKTELEEMQTKNQHWKLRAEQLATHVDTQKSRIQQAWDHIGILAKDHATMQSLVESQQEELNAAHSIRTQLLRTLLQQEDEDAPTQAERTRAIQNLLSSSQLRVEKVALLVGKEPAGTSPSNAADPQGSSFTEGKTKKEVVPSLSKVPQEPEESKNLYSERGNSYEEYPQVDPELEDDISAMTEHTNF